MVPGNWHATVASAGFKVPCTVGTSLCAEQVPEKFIRYFLLEPANTTDYSAYRKNSASRGVQLLVFRTFRPQDHVPGTLPLDERHEVCFKLKH